jgi:hypothetical protein
MPLRNATQGEARYFAREMVRSFRGVLVPQEAIASLVKELLPFDPTTFLGSRAITLGPFVYLPDTLLTPDQQISVVVGSCQHLQQFFNNAIQFTTLYATSSEGRAQYQAESMRAQFEVMYARTKTLPTLAELPALLQGYALAQADITLATDMLEVASTTILADLPPSTESGRAAIAWLRVNASDLLASSA